MTGPTTWRTRLAVVVTAASLALTVLSAPSASAAAATCTLTITKVPGPDQYQVAIACTEPLNVASFALYGSDGWLNPDDFLVRFLGIQPRQISGDRLNEDLGARDEIYAKVAYRTSAGGTGTKKTNRVDGYYGCLIDPVC